MLRIKKTNCHGFIMFEAIFTGGNLYAFSLQELLNDLKDIHGITGELFDCCPN